MKLRGIPENAVYLAIGRAIVRKEERDNRSINDSEALGHAQVLQGRYNFVDEKDSAKFGQKVLCAFHFAKLESVPISPIAAASFALDNRTGTTPLHDEVADRRFKGDLGADGLFA